MVDAQFFFFFTSISCMQWCQNAVSWHRIRRTSICAHLTSPLMRLRLLARTCGAIHDDVSSGGVETIADKRCTTRRNYSLTVSCSKNAPKPIEAPLFSTLRIGSNSSQLRCGHLLGKTKYRNSCRELRSAEKMEAHKTPNVLAENLCKSLRTLNWATGSCPLAVTAKNTFG